MRYLLSVDGGGTKTEFQLLCVETGERAEFKSKSSNFKSVGIKKLKEVIEDGKRWISEVNVKPDQIECAVFGMAGYDTEDDYKVIWNELLTLEIPEKNMYLINDGVLAFYAQTQAPGIAVISGTGSIVIGVEKNQKIIRCGGWGFHYSDVGSGYWFGRKALENVLLYCDGCAEHSVFFEKLLKFFKISNYDELPNQITKLEECPDIARTAICVVDAAEEGVEDAVNILEEGFGLLAKQIVSVYKKMSSFHENRMKLVFSGGVLKRDVCRKILINEVQKLTGEIEITCITTEVGAVEGGFNYFKELDK